jgi:PAS domain-containing protein
MNHPAGDPDDTIYLLPGRPAVPAADITGLIIADAHGTVLSAFGTGDTDAARALVGNDNWRQGAIADVAVHADFEQRHHIVYARPFNGGSAFLFCDRTPDVMARFLWNVPFAHDIIDLILTDPYAGMVVAAADGKVAFISPVHEQFFNVRPGEGVGRPVRDVIANSQLPRVIKTGVAEIGEVFELRDGARIVSRQPVKHDGVIAGAIGRVMFKKPQQLQELAQRVSELEHEVEKQRVLALQRQQAEACLKEIVGQSVAIESVRQQIRKVAGLGRFGADPGRKRHGQGTGRPRPAHDEQSAQGPPDHRQFRGARSPAWSKASCSDTRPDRSPEPTGRAARESSNSPIRAPFSSTKSATCR